jgi:hypothetical protein
MTRNQESFRHELQRLINSVSMENGSNTPDWILADYLSNCLQNFDLAVNAREKWYGRDEAQQKCECGPDCPECKAIEELGEYDPSSEDVTDDVVDEEDTEATLWDFALALASDLKDAMNREAK